MCQANEMCYSKSNMLTLEVDCQRVLPIRREAISPAVPGLVIHGPGSGEPIGISEEESVPQTHLFVRLPNLELEKPAKDGGGNFQLRTIRFEDWSRTLRQEYPREGQVTFRLNHDNLVRISLEYWRYQSSLSEEPKRELVAVVALLGLGRDRPEEEEIWPLLEDRNKGSYVSGDLIVLCGTDARWAEELQETISQMVGDQKSREDIWKMAIAFIAEARFGKQTDISYPDELVTAMKLWETQFKQFGHRQPAETAQESVVIRPEGQNSQKVALRSSWRELGRNRENSKGSKGREPFAVRG